MPPRRPLWTLVRNYWSYFFNGAESPFLVWARQVVSESGFELVAEPRASVRVSSVWEVKLKEAPIEQGVRERSSRKLLWKLRRCPTPPIDDDAVMYRCTRDATLAQLDSPRYGFVPGRR